MQEAIKEYTATVGEIVVRDFSKAEVFKKYGIDFCCGGKKTLKEACAEKGLDAVMIETELRALETSTATSTSLPYNDWGLDFLVDYIEKAHHAYVRKRLPEIMGYAIKVASVHGKQHPELPEIRSLVDELNIDLMSHIMKEERVLFPYIKALTGKALNVQPGFGAIRNPINMMQAEHEAAGELMEEIRRLSDNYSVPSDACATYMVFYKMLAEFEDDLHVHVHLENNILFPKAMLLEKANAGE